MKIDKTIEASILISEEVQFPQFKKTRKQIQIQHIQITSARFNYSRYAKNIDIVIKSKSQMIDESVSFDFVNKYYCKNTRISKLKNLYDETYNHDVKYKDIRLRLLIFDNKLITKYSYDFTKTNRELKEIEKYVYLSEE